MKKKAKYVCCTISVFMIIMMGTTFAAASKCSVYGSSHRYSAATCTAPKKCKCGATTGSKLGHSLKLTKTSTTKKGTAKICSTTKKTYKCSKCSYSEVKSTNDTSHSYTSSVTKAATCTATGVKKQKCTYCSYSTTTTIAKIAHTYKMKTNSTSHYEECTKCKATRNKTAHTYKVEYNTTQHWEKCSKCGSIKNKGTHDLRYSDAKNGKHSVSCQKCRYTGSAAHSYTSQVTTKATCNKTGVETKTCSKCGAKTTATISKKTHTYKVEYNTTQHWEKCSGCGSVKNKGTHDLRYSDAKNGKHSISCQKCRYTGSAVHTLVTEITKEATCTSVGTKVEKCKVCTYKTNVTINKVAHRPRGWQQGPQGGETHYKVCNNCAQEIAGTREKHTYDSNGKCTVCNILSVGCMHKRQTAGSCTKDTTCKDCGKVLKKASGHNYKVEYNDTQHWEKCANCLNIKNKGTHDLRGIDLGDGKHSSSCSKCRYTGKEPHIFNSENVCKICGCEKLLANNSLINEQYSPESEEDNKALQAKLKELGYYTSDIDGKMGPGTRKAINQMLEYYGVNRRLDDDATWEDIDTYLYTFIINNKETKAAAEERRKEEIKKEWAELLDVDTDILTAEEEKKFDAIVLAILNSDTEYSMTVESREQGARMIIRALENGDLDDLKIEGTAIFDCSAFVSTILKVTYGFDYIREDGGIYSTYTFLNDKKNFTHSEDYADKGLDIDSLQKGQLILCIDDNGVDHIMMYCGNGMIVHSNGTNDGVTMNKLSADDEYTDIFVSADAGKYDHIYVLTPNK